MQHVEVKLVQHPENPDALVLQIDGRLVADTPNAVVPEGTEFIVLSPKVWRGPDGSLQFSLCAQVFPGGLPKKQEEAPQATGDEAPAGPSDTPQD